MIQLDIVLSLLMAVLFNASIQSYDKSIVVFLTKIGYSAFWISFVTFGKLLGYFLAPFFLEKLLKRFGIFKTYVGSIVIFCETGLILTLLNAENIYVFFMSLVILGFCVNSNLLNIITLFSSTSFGSDLMTIVNAVSNLIAALLLKLSDQKRSLVIFGMTSASILPFLMRDLSKANEFQVKGTPSISKAYFKYQKYFWCSFLLSSSSGLLRQFLPVVLILYSRFGKIADDNLVVNSVILALGEMLSIPIRRITAGIDPKNKIIGNAFVIIVLMLLLFTTMQRQNWLFKICLFLVSGFLSCRRFNIELFMNLKQPEDFNISILLTDNQIRQIANVALLLLGSQIIDFFPFKGLFMSIIAMQFFIIVNLIF